MSFKLENDQLLFRCLSSEEGDMGIVDAIIKLSNDIHHGLKYLGNGDASTNHGAIEAHGMCIKELATSASDIASAIGSVALAISELADAIRDK